MKYKKANAGKVLLLLCSCLIATATCTGQIRSGVGDSLAEEGKFVKPKLHILAIGIDDYDNRNIGGTVVPDLKHAKADARAFTEAIVHAGARIFEINKQILLDGQATRARIEGAFEEIAKQAKPQDTFVFHFAGHAVLWSGTKSQDDLYLLAADTSRQEITVDSVRSAQLKAAISELFSFDSWLKGKGITSSQLKAWLAKISAQKVLIALDTAESGKALEVFASRIVGEEHSLTSQLLGRRVVVLGLDGVSIEKDDLGHGVFSYVLMRGLAGEADIGPVDGTVMAKELEAYLYGALLKISEGKVRARTYAIGEDFPLGLSDTSKNSEEKRGVLPLRAESKISEPPANWKGRSYALLFGTNLYDDPGWRALSNPIRDARALAAELKTNYGFEVDLVENPTLADMLKKLQFYLTEKKYVEDDQLFIFIAGHGTFDESLNMGFVAAKDSKAKDLIVNNSALMHSNLYRIVDRIPCKHIFLVLDACFGGTFDQIIADKTRSDSDLRYPEASRLEIITRKKGLKTRLYLTSGGKEYVADGTPGAHSPFAAQLLKALRTYGGDSRILTFMDIVQHVEKVKGPQPRWNWFGDFEPSSDFFFIAQPAEKK